MSNTQCINLRKKLFTALKTREVCNLILCTMTDFYNTPNKISFNSKFKVHWNYFPSKLMHYYIMHLLHELLNVFTT